VGKTRERFYLDDARIEGRIILNWLFRKCDVGMDWIAITQGRDGWWGLENATMNLQFP